MNNRMSLRILDVRRGNERGAGDFRGLIHNAANAQAISAAARQGITNGIKKEANLQTRCAKP